MKPFVATALAITLAATSAVAGVKLTWPVTIDMKARTASGTFSDTRAAPDSVSHLACAAFTSVEATPYSYAVCTGANPTANFYCYSYAPEFVAAVRAHSDYISLTWDANGNCQRIYTSRDSFSAPVLP
jgi:hypothetical protein